MATGEKNFVDFNIFQHHNKAGLPVVKNASILAIKLRIKPGNTPNHYKYAYSNVFSDVTCF
jgi:hypothetical protein